MSNDLEHFVLSSIAGGDLDGAMLLIIEARTTALGITPKQAHLVRAGLSAGRLLESDQPLIPQPHRSRLRVIK